MQVLELDNVVLRLVVRADNSIRQLEYEGRRRVIQLAIAELSGWIAKAVHEGSVSIILKGNDVSLVDTFNIINQT